MKELILLTEYCSESELDLDFLLSLESEGLIEFEIYEQEKYLKTSQLEDVELFSRLHYDLSINFAGLDVVRNLLMKMRSMQHELEILRRHSHGELMIEEYFCDEF